MLLLRQFAVDSQNPPKANMEGDLARRASLYPVPIQTSNQTTKAHAGHGPQMMELWAQILCSQSPKVTEPSFPFRRWKETFSEMTNSKGVMPVGPPTLLQCPPPSPHHTHTHTYGDLGF